VKQGVLERTCEVFCAAQTASDENLVSLIHEQVIHIFKQTVLCNVTNGVTGRLISRWSCD
jgi:hypothetical protein